ncbi:hypothetical protein ATY41_07800 [Leifsonia xyli subsp. xyli]|uniref:Signal transduction histidine kinase n=1 Tax=Leifsonia xyli subsp. xyli TaxID=59736 RepID=A0A1E2SMW8_LEIXY|nr:hypothetical protein ATY41_07800 [Leifsonia xyli subsp. xyli]
MRKLGAVRARRLIARATGPAAITWWTWLVTVPFALTVMSGLQYVTGDAWAVTAVASLVHAVVGALLLEGNAVLRVIRGWVRVLVVFLIFAAIGVLRPLLFLVSGAVLDIDVQPGNLQGRILISSVMTVTLFALIAVVVDLVRDHLGVYRRLRAAQRASAVDAERAVERFRELRHSAVEAVLDHLQEAADTAEQDGISPPDAARLLRGLAEQVVRPASHRLYDSAEPAPAPGEGEIRVRRRDWGASVLGHLHAAPPFLLALVYTALVTPFGLQLFGPGSVLLLGTGLVAVWVGNNLLAWLVEATAPALRIVVLLLGYLAIGTLLAATMMLVVQGIGTHPRLVWFEAGTYAIFGLGVSLVASLSSRIRQDQGELEAAVQLKVGTAAELRAAYDHERSTLARLLHSGVQAELIAAALALGTSDGEDASGELRAVVERIRAELLVPRPEPDPAERISALVESWGSAISLRVEIGAEVWDRLRDPVRAETVVDAISEGLANAVRHGDGTQVTLEVRPQGPAGVAVVVTSGGVLTEAGPGIGLRQLAEHGAVVLREEAGRVELAVAIP